jgi:hypothetical protein
VIEDNELRIELEDGTVALYALTDLVEKLVGLIVFRDGDRIATSASLAMAFKPGRTKLYRPHATSTSSTVTETAGNSPLAYVR